MSFVFNIHVKVECLVVLHSRAELGRTGNVNFRIPRKVELLFPGRYLISRFESQEILNSGSREMFNFWIPVKKEFTSLEKNKFLDPGKRWISGSRESLNFWVPVKIEFWVLENVEFPSRISVGSREISNLRVPGKLNFESRKMFSFRLDPS